MSTKRIILGTDHAGFKLKEEIKKFLLEEGFEVDDCGAHEFDSKDDYPKYIAGAARKVAEDPENNRGIVFGGSGQGEAIVANKIKGIRAALYYGGDMEIVKLSRTHNNANVLSLGARFLKKGEAIKAVKLWINTKFSNEARHAKRVNQVKQIEK